MGYLNSIQGGQCIFEAMRWGEFRGLKLALGMTWLAGTGLALASPCGSPKLGLPAQALLTSRNSCTGPGRGTREI